MKIYKKLFLGGIFATFLARFLYKQNNDLNLTSYPYYNEKIPKDFNGYKILQISDLHSKTFGKANKTLISCIDDAQPDVIFVTGDIYYSYKDKINSSLKTLKTLAKKYPIYLVSGNHEQRDPKWRIHLDKILSYKINVIDEKILQIKKGDSYITFCGLKDPSFYKKTFRYEIFAHKARALSLKSGRSQFNILLSHRPELMDTYARYGYDLVFSGHAHGGQVRLFGKGLISPSEGLFPHYTSGVYKSGSTSMVVSRGLGRTVFFTRLFNKPELVMVTLRPFKSK